jgi:uncharacterized protein
MPKMLPVKVHPRARIEKVEHLPTGEYAIWTTAAPDRGEANSAVARLLARELGVAPSRLVLRRGATSRSKLFEVLE